MDRGSRSFHLWPRGPITHGSRGEWKRRVQGMEDRKQNAAITGRGQGQDAAPRIYPK